MLTFEFEMNNNNRNKEEFILYAFIIGVFFFMLTVLNSNNYSYSQNSFDQQCIITELSEVNHSATLSSIPFVPDFNNFWVTSDYNSLKQKPNTEISIFISNSIFKIKYKLCSEVYINIKPIGFKVISTFLYSLYDNYETPAVA